MHCKYNEFLFVNIYINTLWILSIHFLNIISKVFPYYKTIARGYCESVLSAFIFNSILVHSTIDLFFTVNILNASYQIILGVVTRFNDYCKAGECYKLVVYDRLLDSLVVECWHRVLEVPGSIPSQGPHHTRCFKNGTSIPLYGTQR